MKISNLRCFNHNDREAVAKCLECMNFFCRECVTEHDDRLLCALCIEKLTKSKEHIKYKFPNLKCLFKFLLGMGIIWIFFFYLGRLILNLPEAFHEGSIWKNQW
ncbi:MAG: rhomboid family protein [Desulfobacterales bacterium]|nr:rhomboid family protein [Desulfobacterales bacterium]